VCPACVYKLPEVDFAEMTAEEKFRFSIDRGGTFTDVYAECPGGKVRVMKLLSEDPSNYPDAPREAIRRILEEVRQGYIFTTALHSQRGNCA